MPEQEFTRRAMYDLVWSRPMTKVAEDLGISDVALIKICVEHRVPTPPRGYWAKKAAGKPTKQIQFHNTADSKHEHIFIRGMRNDMAPAILEALDQERARRKVKPSPIPLPQLGPTAPIQDVHPAIAATAGALRKPDLDNVVRADGHGHCGIEVSSGGVERSIAILNAMAHTLDARGLTLEPAGNCMRVTLPPDSLTLSLTERIERQNHVPNTEELSKEERLRLKEERNVRLGIWSFSRERAYPEFDFIRTGNLCIQIDDQYVSGLRRTWADGKRQRLESLVDDIVGGIKTYLAGIKAAREERERWQRDWERQRRLADLARAREARETQRREFLKRFVAISTEADELKSFLARLQDGIPAYPTGELARMLEWTEARLLLLENELTPEGINSALRERELFPEVDSLSPPEQDEG